MKKYIIFTLILLFSLSGAQAQESSFKTALESFVKDKAFTIYSSGEKSDNGQWSNLTEDSQWSWKKYTFKTQKKEYFQKEINKITKFFQKDCDDPSTNFYYTVDGPSNTFDKWMNFHVTAGNDIMIIGNFSNYSLLINRQELKVPGMRRVCAIEWGPIIENSTISDKGFEGHVYIIEGKCPINKHRVTFEASMSSSKAEEASTNLEGIDYTGTIDYTDSIQAENKEEEKEEVNEQLANILKDAQTNMKGNFEIIGTRAPELLDRGYFISYKDESGIYVEPTLVATEGTRFSYKHDFKDITMGRVRALMKDGTVCTAWIEIPFVPGEIAELRVYNGYYGLDGSSFYKEWFEEVNESHKGWDEQKFTEYALAKIHKSGVICYLFYHHLIKSTANQKKIYKALPKDLQNNHVGRFVKKYIDHRL